MKKKNYSIDNALIIIGTIVSIGVWVVFNIMSFVGMAVSDLAARNKGTESIYTTSFVQSLFLCSGIFFFLFFVNHVVLATANAHASHEKDEKRRKVYEDDRPWFFFIEFALIFLCLLSHVLLHPTLGIQFFFMEYGMYSFLALDLVLFVLYLVEKRKKDRKEANDIKKESPVLEKQD